MLSKDVRKGGKVAHLALMFLELHENISIVLMSEEQQYDHGKENNKTHAYLVGVEHIFLGENRVSIDPILIHQIIYYNYLNRSVFKSRR